MEPVVAEVESADACGKALLIAVVRPLTAVTPSLIEDQILSKPIAISVAPMPQSGI